jgi:hypothetical protein
MKNYNLDRLLPFIPNKEIDLSFLKLTNNKEITLVIDESHSIEY